MDTSSPTIAVATVNALDDVEVVNALEAALNGTVARKKLSGLAGPNDILQLLATPAGWAAVGVSIFVTAGIAEIGKQAGAALWSHRRKLIQALAERAGVPLVALWRAMQARKTDVITPKLAIPCSSNAARNATMAASLDSEVAFVESLLTFIGLAPAIHSLLEKPRFEQGENSVVLQLGWADDCSTSFEYSAPGVISVGGVYEFGSPTAREKTPVALQLRLPS